MDLLFPPAARVSKITPSVISNTALARSIFSGAARTLARSGDRMGFDLTVSGANDRESVPLRAMLRNLRATLRGQANRVWFADPSYTLRGSFPTGELIPNGLFTQGATGWTTSNASLTVADGFARVQNTGAAAGAAGSASAVTIVSGAAYVARALLYPGNQLVPSWAVDGGTAALGTGYISSGTITAQGMFVGSFTASGTTFFLSLICSTATANDFAHFLFASLSRCILVNGGAQVGPNLQVSALPLGINGLLMPGDRVQIGTQLNEVAAPLCSNGSGVGFLQCAVPWRVAPANAAPIIIDKPMARCILTDNSGSWDESPGKYADFEFQLEESLDA